MDRMKVRLRSDVPMAAKTDEVSRFIIEPDKRKAYSVQAMCDIQSIEALHVGRAGADFALRIVEAHHAMRSERRDFGLDIAAAAAAVGVERLRTAERMYFVLENQGKKPVFCKPAVVVRQCWNSQPPWHDGALRNVVERIGRNILACELASVPALDEESWDRVAGGATQMVEHMATFDLAPKRICATWCGDVDALDLSAFFVGNTAVIGSGGSISLEHFREDVSPELDIQTASAGMRVCAQVVNRSTREAQVRLWIEAERP